MRLVTCFYLLALLTLSMGVNAGPSLGSVAWSASVATSNSLSTTSTGDPSIWCDERLAVIPEGRVLYAQSCVATVLAITTDLTNNATTSVVLVALNASSGQTFASLPLPVSSPGTPSVDNGPWPSYSGWVTCLPPPAETRLGTACVTLVTSTAAGIFAANVNTTGGLSPAWEVYFSAPPPEGTPAHCTVAALANVVMCTVEAGRKSTLVTAYNVSTGDVVWTTDDQGFTLVWLANAGTSAVYGGRTMADGDLAIVARAVQGGAPQWRLGNLTFSPPGLWDNPNLDVDRDPKCSHRAFMYGKPHIGLRTITALDGATGQQLWELRDENATVIADYDTFAAECDFFRLRIYQALPSDVPRTVLQRVYGVDGVRRWTTRLANFTDTNGVLLVGAGRVFVFGLTSNMIGAVTSDTGAQLGSMQMQGAISSGHTFALALNDTTTVDAFVLAETVTTTGGSQTSLVVVQLPTL